MVIQSDKLGSRLIHIDSLRAVAVILVIWHHYFLFASPRISNDNLSYIGNFFILYGTYGVQLFFTLSGFIILIREKNKIGNENFFQFMLLRYTRLWPGIFLLVLISLPLIEFKTWLLALIPAFTLIDPIIFNKASGLEFVWMSDVMWTLFSEVRFYAIFAFIFTLARSKSLRTRVFLVVSILGLGKLVTFFFAGSEIFRAIEFVTLSRDSSYFVLGILLGLVFDSSTSSLVARIRVVIIPVFVSLCFEICTIMPAAQAFFALIPIIAFMIMIRSRNQLTMFLARYLGASSYISYLAHLNAMLLVYKVLGTQSLLFELFIFPIFVFAFAYYFGKILEPEAIRLLRRLMILSK